MIANNRISTVLVSTDLKRSQEFYESKVGLTLSPETIKNHLIFECGDGTTLLIYGRGNGNKADHTQARFWSTDIDKDVALLAASDIEFDEYEDRRPHRQLTRHRPFGLVQGPRREHDRGVPAGVGHEVRRAQYSRGPAKEIEFSAVH
jgi:catechol 2,3-dioxygenase-like lactoylglutathione lyase family enzyme